VTHHSNPDHAHQDGPVRLAELAEELLGSLSEQSSGRAARTLLAGPRMRATVIALAEGAELAEHESPPAATLQVLRGDVTLQAQTRSWELHAGDLVPIPPERHGVQAHSDAVLLLTVTL